jgi:hypothetical protein
MNNFFRITAMAGLALSCLAPDIKAEPPTYATLNASGTTTAVVHFATSPQQQIRIVGAIASSDLAGANIILSGGTTAATCAYTNPIGTSFGVSRTNGFAVGDFVLIEKASGAMTNGQITAFGAATNIVLGQNIFATQPGDQLYKLDTPVSLWCGVQTNRNFQGEALFVGQRGRPVRVLVNGTSACSLDSVTARYE